MRFQRTTQLKSTRERVGAVSHPQRTAAAGAAACSDTRSTEHEEPGAARCTSALHQSGMSWHIHNERGGGGNTSGRRRRGEGKPGLRTPSPNPTAAAASCGQKRDAAPGPG